MKRVTRGRESSVATDNALEVGLAYLPMTVVKGTMSFRFGQHAIDLLPAMILIGFGAIVRGPGNSAF